MAGDNASREKVAGAISGGGNINSAWALSSGCSPAQAAARLARARAAARPGSGRSVGPVARLVGSRRRSISPPSATACHGEMHPFDKICFAAAPRLRHRATRSTRSGPSSPTTQAQIGPCVARGSGARCHSALVSYDSRAAARRAGAASPRGPSCAGSWPCGSSPSPAAWTGSGSPPTAPRNRAPCWQFETTS